MGKVRNATHQVKLAFSSGGLRYVLHRLPSILFWTMVSTGLLIGVQFLFFQFMPSQYFFRYDSPATVRDTVLGQPPILDYCRTSKASYNIEVTAQLQKVTPPVYVQNYQVTSTLPAGHGCLSREIAAKPKTTGQYKVYYTIEATLPYGIKKYTTFESKPFNVGTPEQIYGDYELTVADKAYMPGNNLEYRFSGNQLVETFGTTVRALVCDGKDYIIDTYSGRSASGQKDSTNNTATIPDGASGKCYLELRISSTIEGSDKPVTETLRSNTFAVQ